MNWMENLLIIAGVSLDIFAAMECQGSLVAKINKKNLTVICGIVALAQLITLYLGHFLSSLFCHYRSVPDGKSNPQRTCGRTSGTSSWNPEICPHGMYQWNLHAAYGNCIWISGNECAYDSDHDCCMYRCICDRRHLYRISCRI